MINILTRYSVGRVELFKRCLKSIQTQTYKDINLIVSADSEKAIEEASGEIKLLRGLSLLKSKAELIEVIPDKSKPFHWNLYCNDLKSKVTEGWFMYVDSDDFLANPNVLTRISPHLKDERYAVMCRFLRHGRPKPTNRNMGKIIRGAIGGSCIILHHTHKNVANWQSCKAADYFFMKDVAEKLPMRWTNVVVVEAGNGGLKGKQP